MSQHATPEHRRPDAAVRRAERIPAIAPKALRPPPTPDDVAGILVLQRTVGNSTVGALLEDRADHGRQARRAVTPAGTGTRRAVLLQRRPPDVSFNNYLSFYLRSMVPVTNGEVRVQFHQDPAEPTATFAVWYQETKTLQTVSFTPTGRIQPELLQEKDGVATFDLTGDGQADVHLVAEPNTATLGLDFVADLPGGNVFRMRTLPAGSPPRRVPFGRLPDGRDYYLVPTSTWLPQGPMFVDERNQMVNPGLEARNAQLLREVGKGYLVGYVAILTIALIGVAAEGAAAGAVAGTEVAAGTTMTSGQLGQVIGWGTGQTAAAIAQTEAVAQALTTQAIRQMIARGLTRKWVEAQLAMYESAIAQGGSKLLNKQLLPRLALMRRMLELWPK